MSTGGKNGSKVGLSGSKDPERWEKESRGGTWLQKIAFGHWFNTGI